MTDYKKMYHSLFSDVTSVISRLQEAQRKTEEIFIESKETTLKLLKDGPDNKQKGPSFNLDKER